MPTRVPKIIASTPKMRIIIFFTNFQPRKPKPSSQNTIMSIITGNISPRTEKNNAPIIVINGDISGTAIARITVERKRKKSGYYL